MAAKVQRDRFFWTVALQTLVVNFFLGGFGPAQPLLQKDQSTSGAIAGLHGTAMGIASIVAGLTLPWIAHRLGRANAGWTGLIIFSGGLLALATVQPVQLTILASFVTGYGCSLVINSFVVSLNGHYGEMAPLAVTQANSVASVGYVFGTFTIGTIARTAPAYWRLALIVILPVALYLFFFRREKNVDAHVPASDGPQSGKLSLSFWLTWTGFVATISTEFATAFWAAELIQERTGASDAISIIAIMGLGTGMGLGRFFGGRIMHRLSLDHQLLVILGIQFFGFFGLWFSHTLALSLLLLLINGLGISMQFGLTSLRLISHSENRPELAIGKSSIAAGIAIGAAPFLLGVLKDTFDISRAYLMVPALIIFAIAIVILVPSYLSQEILDKNEI